MKWQPMPARALDPEKSLSQYALDVWTTENGLPQNSVTALAQTSDGYLWIGTYQGLARFDGLRFTVFEAATTEGLNGDRILIQLPGIGDPGCSASCPRDSPSA